MASAGWSDLAGWGGSASPSLLVMRGLRWTIIFLGFVAGVAAFDPTLTSQLTLRLVGSAMNLVTALVLLIVGNVVARFLSLGVKWLVLILSTAMALDHLSIGGPIVELAFGILFGGIVLTLALAIALRSKDLADWSLRREQKSREEEKPTFHHL